MHVQGGPEALEAMHAHMLQYPTEMERAAFLLDKVRRVDVLATAFTSNK